ncbi:acyltransferase family protein [Rhizobium sp. PAMB 3174]
MKYNPALDGLRAISVLLVVAFHSNLPFVPGGMIGVDIFFVLSGFLITAILRQEIERKDTLSLTTFYGRRLLRLWPPLIAFLVAFYLAAPFLFPKDDANLEVLLAGLYLSDYSHILFGMPSAVSHTWSLAVEQQFYLLWPLALLALRKVSVGTAIALLAASFLFATCWRMADRLIWDDWYRTYFRFDTRLSGLILGSLMAFVDWKPRAPLAGAIGALSICVLVALSVSLQFGTTDSMTWGSLTADFAAAGLILSLTATQETRHYRLLSHPALVYIGVISYSIYLWHYPVAKALRAETSPLVTFVVTSAFAILAAMLSYRLIERPVQALRQRHAVASPR